MLVYSPFRPSQTHTHTLERERRKKTKWRKPSIKKTDIEFGGRQLHIDVSCEAHASFLVAILAHIGSENVPRRHFVSQFWFPSPSPLLSRLIDIHKTLQKLLRSKVRLRPNIFSDFHRPSALHKQTRFCLRILQDKQNAMKRKKEPKRKRKWAKRSNSKRKKNFAKNKFCRCRCGIRRRGQKGRKEWKGNQKNIYPKSSWTCLVMSKNTQNPLTVPPGTHSLWTDRFLQSVKFREIWAKKSFRFLCKMAVLAPKVGHISRYSCPFDLISPVDSSKCPLKNNVLGGLRTNFDPDPPPHTHTHTRMEVPEGRRRWRRGTKQ